MIFVKLTAIMLFDIITIMADLIAQYPLAIVGSAIVIMLVTSSSIKSERRAKLERAQLQKLKAEGYHD